MSPRKLFGLGVGAYLTYRALLAMLMIAASFRDPLVYAKDISLNHMAAKAMQASLNPYASVEELSREIDGYDLKGDMRHPHLPGVMLLTYPFAWFPYPWVAAGWVVFCLGCLVGGVHLIRGWGESPPDLATSLGVGFLLIGASPVSRDLVLGQWSCPILLCLVLFARAWLKEQEVVAGLWLGLSLSTKLMGWPLVLLILKRGRWRALVAAGVVFALSHLLFWLLLVPLDVISTYYLELVPETKGWSRPYLWNMSVMAFGQRLFGPLSVIIGDAPSIPPLMDAPALIGPVNGFGLLVLLGIIVWALLRDLDDRVVLALGVAASVVGNPIAWDHYFTLLVLPLGLTAMRIGLTPGLGLFVALFYVGNAGAWVWPPGGSVTPFSAQIVMVPTLTLLAFMAWLVAREPAAG